MLDAPLSMTTGLRRAAGERLHSWQQNHSARCAAFGGFANSRGHSPRLLLTAWNRLIHKISPGLHFTCIVAAVNLKSPGWYSACRSAPCRALRTPGMDPCGRSSHLAPWDRAGTSPVPQFSIVFAHGIELSVYQVIGHPGDSRRMLLAL